MGVGDWVKNKVQGAVDSIPGNPVPAVIKALDTPATPVPPAEAKTPQQAAYEAKEKYMNRNNPGYEPIPRAKGGRVKAGGHPMKNVDNSGMTKMKMGCK